MSKKVISQIKLTDNLEDIFVVENDDKNAELLQLSSAIESLTAELSSIKTRLAKLESNSNYNETDPNSHDSSDEI